MSYKASGDYNVPMAILIPVTKRYNGVTNTVFPEPGDTSEENIFFGNFKTFGGTEGNVNGVYTITDTANVETWYRPDIKVGCRIALLPDGEIFEIIGRPENVEQKFQIMKIKLKKVGT